MASTYPSSLDNFTNPLNTDKLNNPPHATQHADNNDAIKALQAKVGTGASTPANNTFLIGNGAGTSAYSTLTSAQLAARISDETGTGLSVFNDTPTIITPTIASFTNATHNHTNAAGGGQITRSSFDTTYTTEINTDWKAGILPAVSSVTENGNRSADITFASTVANILTPGMRIRTTRTVAAPTGAILLNGTTQYASKATPSNMTQTDDISPFGHFRLTNYPGARATINSKFSTSGTNNGWIFSINSSGQVVIEGFNATNTRSVTSYQSVPLNKWVHVTASLDLSGWTTATNKIMIDGVDVPVFLTNGVGTPASFVSAGNYDVGCYNTAVAATGFFTGNLGQVGFFNGNVSTITQATLRGYKNQTLSGSETSIIAVHKLDQASGLNDLTANANNLTATGSPTYTAGSSPFATNANGTAGGTYDYAIVTNVSTTVATVQYPEGCAIPTSGGISTVDYSGVANPFGMPAVGTRWTISVPSSTLEDTMVSVGISTPCQNIIMASTNADGGTARYSNNANVRILTGYTANKAVNASSTIPFTFTAPYNIFSTASNVMPSAATAFNMTVVGELYASCTSVNVNTAAGYISNRMGINATCAFAFTAIGN